MPFALILGRGYAEGKVELRVRGGEKSELDADQAVAQIVEMVAQARN